MSHSIFIYRKRYFFVLLRCNGSVLLLFVSTSFVFLSDFTLFLFQQKNCYCFGCLFTYGCLSNALILCCILISACQINSSFISIVQYLELKFYIYWFLEQFWNFCRFVLLQKTGRHTAEKLLNTGHITMRCTTISQPEFEYFLRGNYVYNHYD